jgi:hypothetical protein
MLDSFDSVFRMSDKHTFRDLLWLSKSFEKTEPRDSVFAILGLLSRDNNLEDEHTALLEVDYTKTVLDVLKDASRYALCQDGNLEMLGMISHRPKQLSEEFPSWVLRADLLREQNDVGPLPKIFSASQGLHRPSLLRDMSYTAQVLLCEGFVVGQVLQTTSTYAEGSSTISGLYSGLLGAKAMVKRHCDHALQEDPGQAFMAMASVITAGMTRQGLRAQLKDLEIFSEYLASLGIDEIDYITPETFHNSIANDKHPGHLSRGEALAEMDKSLYFGYCLHRHFFVTSKGGMGLGPELMRADDLVVILRGGRLPFILRKMDKFYQFIGPACVHGIMDGEAVKIWKAKNEPETIFPIR